MQILPKRDNFSLVEIFTFLQKDIYFQDKLRHEVELIIDGNPGGIWPQGFIIPRGHQLCPLTQP